MMMMMPTGLPAAGKPLQVCCHGGDRRRDRRT